MPARSTGSSGSAQRSSARQLDAHGIRIDALAAKLDELKAQGVTPKCIYTIPTIQNPTGSILPLERRQALLALARERGIAIFEDECYADLLWVRVGAAVALCAGARAGGAYRLVLQVARAGAAASATAWRPGRCCRG